MTGSKKVPPRNTRSFSRQGLLYPDQPEARKVRDTGYEDDRMPRKAANVLRSGYKVPVRAKGLRFELAKVVKVNGNRELQPLFGRKLGAGAYGTVTATKYGKLMRDMYDVAAFKVVNLIPLVNSGVAVKLQIPNSQRERELPITTRDFFSTACVRESGFHQMLASAPCVRLPGTSKPLCSSEYVPKFYWSGVVRDDGGVRSRVHVTAMSRAPGIPLVKFVAAQPGGKMPLRVYLELERAFASLWVNGVVHGDSHKGNVFYDQRTGRVTVIDFGFNASFGNADALDTNTRVVGLRRALVHAIATGARSLGQVWLTGRFENNGYKYGVNIDGISNRLQTTRHGGGVDWYNPEGQALMQWYNLLSLQDRSRLPQARRDLWGFTGSFQRKLPNRKNSARASAVASDAAGILAL